VTHFTLEQIRAFLAVAEAGSLSSAARSLGRTQPAITYLVRSLEEQLQCSLFQRSAQGVTLTPQAQALLPAALAIRNESEQFDARVQSLAVGLSEALVIAVDYAAPKSVIARTAKTVRGQHPGVALTIRTAILDDVSEMVNAGKAELGLISMFAELPPDIHRVEVARSGIVLVVSPDHELAGEKVVTSSLLRQHLQLVPEDSHGDIALRSYAVFGSPIWRVNDLSLMLEFLRSGLGFAVTPDHAVEADVLAGRLAPLQLAFPAPQIASPSAFYLIWRSDRPLSPAAQWFVDAAVTAHAAWKPAS
jgi:DNA-binding transcriptional LysR family regulator